MDNSQSDRSDINISDEINPGQPNTARITRAQRRKDTRAGWVIVLIFVFIIGLAGGYGLSGITKSANNPAGTSAATINSLVKEIYPENGYSLPIALGDLGAQMVSAGVIDRAAFIQTYEQAGKPLSTENLAMLDGTFSGAVVMNQSNAYFFLNFFWALGLANENPILENGPIQQKSQGNIEGFASTGGWTLATKPIREVISSKKMLVLTPDQQKRVEEAAQVVYRPCCNNPTHFPDCNHGMAMLGLLELMGSQNASLDEMLNIAKYANAYWYPQQTLEQAIYFKYSQGKEYKDVDSRTIVGQQYSSGTGFAALHKVLEEKSWLPQSSNNGASCGV